MKSVIPAVVAFAVFILTLLEPCSGSRKGWAGGQSRDVNNWRKLQSLLREHSKEHMTQGMSSKSKVEAMQLAASKVRRLQDGSESRPLLEIETRDGLCRRIREGSIWARNGTVYGHPQSFPGGALEGMSYSELLKLAGQYGVLRMVRMSGMGSSFGSKKQRMVQLIKKCNNPSTTVRDRLLHLKRPALKEIAMRLGMGQRDFTHLDKRSLVDRLCKRRRWRSCTHSVLAAEFERRQRVDGAVSRKTPKSKGDLVAALEMGDDIESYLERLHMLERLTLPSLIDRFLADGLAPERICRIPGQVKLRGPVGAGRGDAWLRELNIQNGRDLAKADMIYRVMSVYDAAITTGLVDDGVLEMVARVHDGRYRGSLNAIAERSRRALCFSRCRARYHHSNEDGTWTISTSKNERMRVTCAIHDRRLDKGGVSFPSLITKRVEAAKKGLKVAHVHGGASCFLCDPRFAPVPWKDSESMERELAVKMARSRATAAAWRRHGGKGAFLGGESEEGGVDGAGSIGGDVHISEASSVLMGRLVDLLGRFDPPESRTGMWTRRMAEKVCRDNGMPFCSYRVWSQLRKKLPTGRKKEPKHVHLKGVECPGCPTVKFKAEPGRGGGAKRIGKGKRQKKRKKPRVIEGDANAEVKRQDMMMVVQDEEEEMPAPIAVSVEDGDDGLVDYRAGALEMQRRMQALMSKGGFDGGDSAWD
jgi:hypothetical protein